MSATINTSNATAKSLGLKILSVVGLTIFTGFYVNSWQRSLAEYAQQQQAETTVATSAANTSQTVATTSTSEPTVIPSTAEVSPVVDTTNSVSAVNTVSQETTTPVVTEVSMSTQETPAAAETISDSNTLNKLSSTLYNQIDKTWQQQPTFSENLVYRVTINSEGNVAKYEHINQAASEYIAETPLPKLTNSSTTKLEDATKETAEFLVVLAPDGVLQVSQWVAK